MTKIRITARGVVIDSKRKKAGDIVDASGDTARILLGMGKAVPHGDKAVKPQNRDQDAALGMMTRAKKIKK